MITHYNRLAGHSIERLAALSDGVFAVAMTLLVLDLRAPAIETIHSEADLRTALVNLAPRLLVYMMSFLTLGIFWIGQQTQLNYLARSDRNLAWLHLVFLFAVTTLPFSTALMAEFFVYRTALAVYWVNLALFGALLFATSRYAGHAHLLKADAPPELLAGANRRIVIAQSLYAFGALMAIVDTHLSIAIIIAVQLVYAIAPRLPLLWRL
jgi:uncharacterized membrane protein